MGVKFMPPARAAGRNGRWLWIVLILVLGLPATGACEQPGPFVNSLGMTFLTVSPGGFRMGSPGDEPGRGADEALQTVIIRRPFQLQRTETTQAQWRAVMGDNPAHFQGCDDCPVENVSWRDVREFIHRLNRIEETRAYRLPTEAEWEYACRAGRAAPFTAGRPVSRACEYGPQHDPLGWYLENSADRTHPVGRKEPNEWGFHDMHGNVWEWCADYYARRRPSAEPLVDPTGPGHGWGRVFKGGAYNFTAECSRAANRKWTTEVFRCRSIGFRLARDVDP